MTIRLPKGLEDEDQLLLRYVLGLLGPEEAGRLDEASVADDEFAARLRAVEEDMIDAYVRSALTGKALTRFESRYLSSSRLRKQVARARRFLRAIDRAVAHERAKIVR